MSFIGDTGITLYYSLSHKDANSETLTFLRINRLY